MRENQDWWKCFVNMWEKIWERVESQSYSWLKLQIISVPLQKLQIKKRKKCSSSSLILNSGFSWHSEGPTEPDDHMMFPATPLPSAPRRLGHFSPRYHGSPVAVPHGGVWKLDACVSECVRGSAHVRERSPSPRQNTGSNWYGLVREGHTCSDLLHKYLMLIFSHNSLYSNPHKHKSEHVHYKALLKTIFWRGAKKRSKHLFYARGGNKNLFFWTSSDKSETESPLLARLLST